MSSKIPVTIAKSELGVIKRYLKTAINSGDKFYTQQQNSSGKSVIKAIHFNPNDLDSDKGIKIAEYFKDLEKKGNNIYVLSPNKPLQKLTFKKND